MIIYLLFYNKIIPAQFDFGSASNMHEILNTTDDINKFLVEDFKLESNEGLLLEIRKDDIKFMNNMICNSVNSSAILSTTEIAYQLSKLPISKLKSWIITDHITRYN